MTEQVALHLLPGKLRAEVAALPVPRDAAEGTSGLTILGEKWLAFTDKSNIAWTLCIVLPPKKAA